MRFLNAPVFRFISFSHPGLEMIQQQGQQIVFQVACRARFLSASPTRITPAKKGIKIWPKSGETQNLKDFFSHMSIKDQNLIDSPCLEGVFCAGDFYVASPFVGDRNGFNRGIRCLMMFDDARHDVRHGVWWFVVPCKAVYQGTPRADGVQLEEVHKMYGFAKGRNRTE